MAFCKAALSQTENKENFANLSALDEEIAKLDEEIKNLMLPFEKVEG